MRGPIFSQGGNMYEDDWKEEYKVHRPSGSELESNND